jgi:transposase
MRKVELSMDENGKYEVIKKLVDTNGNKNKASIKLQCTIRTIDRMIIGYKEKGKVFFIHGNTGRIPANTISNEKKQEIVDLYKTKYYDANFNHFNELLEEHENIKASYSTIKKTMAKENILSPKATRKTKKNMKKKLEESLVKSGLSSEDKKVISETIVAIEDAHPRRPRCKYFGEMLQMDASLHLWFGESKSTLHIAVDDSTGIIVGAYFDKEETLNGYYNIFNQILTKYGIPNMFFTDRRTVFEYSRKNSPNIEEDTFTQFGYACHQLGIEIKTSSIPQAKGRVERFFETLQSRLIIELRLAGVTTIEQANEFLKHYLKKFNERFGLSIDYNKSVFEKQPSNSEINLLLAVITDRKIDSGHCIRFNNKYYKTVDTDNKPVYHKKGTEALVIKAFDGNLYANVQDRILGLEEIAIKEAISKNFDTLLEQPKQTKRYIPPMSHPWRQASFQSFLKKQAHLKDKVA